MNTTTPTEQKIGDKMSDGTIYAGMSTDTKKPMYAMSQDAPMTLTFHEAAVYAAKLNAHGQNGRAPTKAELKVLSDYHVDIGGFNLTGSSPASWYWSASKYYKRNAWVRRFSDRCQNYLDQGSHSSLRCQVSIREERTAPFPPSSSVGGPCPASRVQDERADPARP